MENNIAIVNEHNYIDELKSGATMYCSMKPKNDDERAILFKAMNNPDYRISDFVNKTIEMKHLFVENVSLTNSQTGEIQDCPRVVIIDKDGKGYQAVSKGVFSALKKLLMMYGDPITWTTPLKLEVISQLRGERRMLSFNVVK